MSKFVVAVVDLSSREEGEVLSDILEEAQIEVEVLEADTDLEALTRSIPLQGFVFLDEEPPEPEDDAAGDVDDFGELAEESGEIYLDSSEHSLEDAQVLLRQKGYLVEVTQV